MKHLATRHQQLQLGARFQQGSQIGGSRNDLLEVVEDQQEVLLMEEGLHERKNRMTARLLQSQRVGDGGQDERWIPQRREREEQHSTGGRLNRAGRHLERQAGFAHPRRPRQGDQADVRALQQLRDSPRLLRPPDQWSRWHREVAPDRILVLSKNLWYWLPHSRPSWWHGWMLSKEMATASPGNSPACVAASGSADTSFPSIGDYGRVRTLE